MDCSTSAAAPTSSTSALSPPRNRNGRIAWPGGPAKKQLFSLPDNIIYYMARNPKSPELFLKLAKSCKYFFEMFPLLVAKIISVDENGKRMCTNDSRECMIKKQKCCVTLDLEKFTKSQIWLTKDLILCKNYDPNLVAFLQPKLYKFENRTINLGRMKITLEEFKLWGTAFTKFAIYKNQITDADGSIVTIDSMLEALTNVKQFVYYFDIDDATITSSTMKKMLQLKNLGELELFGLADIPEVLNVKDLSAFIKAHKDTKFNIFFLPSISADYKLQLDALIDEIIASKVPSRLIKYHGQNSEKLKLLESNFHRG